MNRRQLLVGGAVAGGLVLLWRWIRRNPFSGGGMFDRVVFVCCNDAGYYSPGVYLHGADGGGPAALDLVKQAAPYMRDGEVGDAAAGLCGCLFKECGDDVAAGGGLSLYDAPRPGPGGAVDWQAYCSWNVDLVLINVDQGTAECHSGPADPKAPSKSVVKRLSGLRFGG
jgi:hypothetical protein